MCVWCGPRSLLIPEWLEQWNLHRHLFLQKGFEIHKRAIRECRTISLDGIEEAIATSETYEEAYQKVYEKNSHKIRYGKTRYKRSFDRIISIKLRCFILNNILTKEQYDRYSLVSDGPELFSLYANFHQTPGDFIFAEKYFNYPFSI